PAGRRLRRQLGQGVVGDLQPDFEWTAAAPRHPGHGVDVGVAGDRRGIGAGADAADGGGAAVGVGEDVPPAGAWAGGDGAGQFGVHRSPAGEDPGPAVRPGHGGQPGQQPQPTGPADHTGTVAVRGDSGIVVIGIVVEIDLRRGIVVSHAVLIGRAASGQHWTTIVRLHAAGRSWAVFVVWPRPVPWVGVPGVVIPGVVKRRPVGWVGAVFDDGVDAGEQAGEDVAVGEALVGAVDEPDEQVGPQLV